MPSKLIQLVGPQRSGKTTLRQTLCPQAVEVNLESNFIPELEMPNQFQYYFYSNGFLTMRNLQEFLEGHDLFVNRKGKPTTRRFGDFVFIFEGSSPLAKPLPNSFIYRLEAIE